MEDVTFAHILRNGTKIDDGTLTRNECQSNTEAKAKGPSKSTIAAVQAIVAPRCEPSEMGITIGQTTVGVGSPQEPPASRWSAAARTIGRGQDEEHR